MIAHRAALETEAQIGRHLTVRRYRWPSGLRLVAAVDRSAPIVAYQTWFGVGSRNELPGRTGMAHLFEHLMFNQTETMGPGEFDRVVEATGGESNAATWVDWTYYRLSLPAAELPLAVRLEHERMTRLVLEAGPVEAERDVVTNERRERVEDDVDGWLDEQLMALAFTSHSYRWPTIGWMADIRALPLDDIRAFYRTWYAPNNATLVVVGDFDEAQLLALIDATYGGLPAQALPPRDVANDAEPAQVAPREVRGPRPVATERLVAGYKVPGQAHPDWAALELASTMLAGGPSSRLYRRLVVELEMTSSIDVGLTPFAGPAVFRVSATCTRGHLADQVMAEVDAALATLAREPASAAELDKARSLVETDFWTGLVDADGKAEALGHYETTLGDFRMLTEVAARLATVSAADVQRAVATYLTPSQRTLVVAEPDGSASDDDDDDSDDSDDGEAA